MTSPFGEFAGWCLAFFLPAFVMAGPLRRDQGATQGYLFAVLLHVAAAVIYVYLPGVLPTRADSNAFHNFAIEWQSMAERPPLAIGSGFYKAYLTYVYSWFGPSFFLTSILSIYAFALSVIVLAKVMELIDINRGKGIVILLFGSLPTAVLYGSVPLREPYQILFFMLTCYAMLQCRLTGRFLYLLIAVAAAVLMGLLHKGLIIYAPFLIVIMLLVRVDPAWRGSSSTVHVWLHRLAAVGLAIGFVAAMSSGVRDLEGVGGTNVLSAATGGSLVDFAAEHRDEEALTRGRTTYGVALDTSSPSRFVYSMIMIFFYYMFTPFPWHIRNFLDVYAFGEVVLRAATLIAIFRMWRQRGPIHPHIITLLMVVYVSMAFLWAAGTTNYGTATRHHMIHQWILLLLGVPALLQMTFASIRGHPKVQGGGIQRYFMQRPTRAAIPNRDLKPLIEMSWGPPRFRAGGSQPRRLRTLHTAPRPLSGGLGRHRRQKGA